MKRKITILLLILVIIFILTKIFNYLVIKKVYNAIEEFKKCDNRYYFVNIINGYKEKIYLKDKIIKYDIILNDEINYCGWNNTYTNESYLINLKEKIFNNNEKNLNDKSNSLVNLPIIILNTFHGGKTHFSEILDIKYVVPTKYENVDCYKIVTNSEELFIDKTTYLPKYLRIHTYNYEKKDKLTECLYEFKTNSVTEEDVKIPELSEYKKIE